MDLLTIFFRRMGQYAPPWARLALFSSVIVGIFLQIIFIHSPYLQTISKDYFAFEDLYTWQWTVLGIVVTLPPTYMWRLAVRLSEDPSPRDKAEEYISVLKFAVAETKMTRENRIIFWNNALDRLAQGFAVGLSPPSAQEVVEKSKEDVIN